MIQELNFEKVYKLSNNFFLSLAFKVNRSNFKNISSWLRISNLEVDYKTYRRQLHRLFAHNNKYKKLKYSEVFLDANGYNFEDLVSEELYTDTIFTSDIIGSFLGSIRK